jgi:hypothetical protein
MRINLKFKKIKQLETQYNSDEWLLKYLLIVLLENNEHLYKRVFCSQIIILYLSQNIHKNPIRFIIYFLCFITNEIGTSNMIWKIFFRFE